MIKKMEFAAGIQAQDSGRRRWRQRARWAVDSGLCGGGGGGDHAGCRWVFAKGSSKKVLKDDVVVGGGVGPVVSRGGFLVLEGGKIDVLPDLFHGICGPSSKTREW